MRCKNGEQRIMIRRPDVLRGFCQLVYFFSGKGTVKKDVIDRHVGKAAGSDVST